jgi:ribosomal protein S18 acetylase RimI-like enzyme
MDITDIHIREGKTGDMEMLVAFLRQLFTIEKDFTIDADKHRAGLSLLLTTPATSAIFVAEVNGAAAGMVTAQIVVSTSVGGCSVLLEDMYVAAKFRRQSIGSKLLSRVVVWGYERGARRVQLVADMENTAALKFYRQAGLWKSKMIALYGTLDVISPNLA